MTFNKSLNQRMSCAPQTSGETRSISELFIIPGTTNHGYYLQQVGKGSLNNYDSVKMEPLQYGLC